MSEFGTFYYSPNQYYPAAKVKDLGDREGYTWLLVVVWTDSDTRRETAKVALGPGERAFVKTG